MAHDEHHEHLVKELAEVLRPVLDNSPQAVYLYVDDEHKICNDKFASMMGYASVDEWVANQTPLSDVLEEDQEKTINAYSEASENFKASQLSLRFVKKDGSQSEAEVIFVPLSYRNEVFVLHFITEK